MKKNYEKKKYQVIFIDEYDNFTELGVYDNLKEAEPDVNFQLTNYKLNEDDDHPGETPEFGTDKNQGALGEYAGTFGYVFDRVIPVEEGAVQVRGFIKYETDWSKLFKDLSKKHLKKGYKLDKEACAAGMTSTGRLLTASSAREIATGEIFEKLAKIFANKYISPEKALEALGSEEE